MKITPLRNQILIRLEEFEEITETESGIILAEAEKMPPKLIIESFGTDVSIENLSAGDAVYLLPRTGINITDGEAKYKIVSPDEILAKIED